MLYIGTNAIHWHGQAGHGQNTGILDLRSQVVPDGLKVNQRVPSTSKKVATSCKYNLLPLHSKLIGEQLIKITEFGSGAKLKLKNMQGLMYAAGKKNNPQTKPKKPTKPATSRSATASRAFQKPTQLQRI